jgi:hypothetical protein
MQLRGILEITIGLGVFLWIRSHSPQMGFGEIMMKKWTLDETAYNVFLLIAVLFALMGIVTLIRGLQTGKG